MDFILSTDCNRATASQLLRFATFLNLLEEVIMQLWKVTKNNLTVLAYLVLSK
jgi:hypothetical protein